MTNAFSSFSDAAFPGSLDRRPRILPSRGPDIFLSSAKQATGRINGWPLPSSIALDGHRIGSNISREFSHSQSHGAGSSSGFCDPTHAGNYDGRAHARLAIRRHPSNRRHSRFIRRNQLDPAKQPSTIAVRFPARLVHAYRGSGVAARTSRTLSDSRRSEFQQAGFIAPPFIEVP